MAKKVRFKKVNVGQSSVDVIIHSPESRSFEIGCKETRMTFLAAVCQVQSLSSVE